MENREKLLLAYAAAKLKHDGMNQIEIGRRLGISQATVSRFLQDMKKAGILEYEVRLQLHEENAVKADWEEMEDRFLRDRVAEFKILKLAPEGRVLSVNVNRGTSDEYFQFAAKQIISLLTNSSLIGIMWGGTISKIVDAITTPGTAFASGIKLNIRCIPICGDPIYLMNSANDRFSASHLAARLEDVVRGPGGEELPSLLGVPAYISPRLASDQVRSFYENTPGYKRIFIGDERVGLKPLKKEIDTILTGVGKIDTVNRNKNDQTGVFSLERIRQEKQYDNDTLADVAIGDIAGNLIRRTPENKEAVSELNEGWTGLDLGELQNVAKKAVTHRRPGVILAAVGEGKAQIIRKAVQIGCANHLILSRELAYEVLG